MKQKKFYDPYTELLSQFNKAQVEYVVVGMSGINYYALDAHGVFATLDFDVFINPTVANVSKAVSACRKLGYDAAVDGKEMDKVTVKDVVIHKKTIVCSNSYGVLFDLILSVSGYTFAQMACDARIFNSVKIPIKVGQLRKLLRSKKAAGRKKDLLFLKRYKSILEEK